MIEPMNELRVRQEVGERVRRASQSRLTARLQKGRRAARRTASASDW